jgi:hypothetical protein
MKYLHVLKTIFILSDIYIIVEPLKYHINMVKYGYCILKVIKSRKHIPFFFLAINRGKLHCTAI